MLNFLLSPQFLICYVIYSIVGWFILSEYLVECIHAKIPGFSGSLTISILMAFVCGGITTIILFYTFCEAMWITIRDWKKEEKDVDTDEESDIL